MLTSAGEKISILKDKGIKINGSESSYPLFLKVIFNEKVKDLIPWDLLPASAAKNKISGGKARLFFL